MTAARLPSNWARHLVTALAAGALLTACGLGTSETAETRGDEELTSSADEPSPPGDEQNPPADEPTASAEGEDDGVGALDGDLPPIDPLALEPLYGEPLAAAGVELTDRGGLIDRTEGYEVSAEGTHLALYVSPIGDRSDEEYVDGIVELARVFLMDVFERWPTLESFDICQELSEDQVEDDYVRPVTQIDISREAASVIDWEHATLVDLYTAAAEDDEVTVRAIGELQSHPRLVEARREAGGEERSGWGS